MRNLSLFFLMMLGYTQQVAALSVDVGMITRAEGKVEHVPVRGAKQAATSFIKVGLGDKLILGKDARIQLVYFETSRQESWQGNGEIEIANGEGKSTSLQAEVRKLPPLVARQLVKTPLSGQHGATGMVTVRSLSSDTVESLEKQYEEFRASSPLEDATPEVFLMTGLIEMKEFEQADARLKELSKKLPAQPALAPVIENFEPLIKQGLETAVE
jgi:hypothetical protein